LNNAARLTVASRDSALPRGAKAAPDGCAIGMGQASNLAIDPALYLVATWHSAWRPPERFDFFHFAVRG